MRNFSKDPSWPTEDVGVKNVYFRISATLESSPTLENLEMKGTSTTKPPANGGNPSTP